MNQTVRKGLYENTVTGTKYVVYDISVDEITLVHYVNYYAIDKPSKKWCMAVADFIKKSDPIDNSFATFKFISEQVPIYNCNSKQYYNLLKTLSLNDKVLIIGKDRNYIVSEVKGISQDGIYVYGIRNFIPYNHIDEVYKIYEV